MGPLTSFIFYALLYSWGLLAVAFVIVTLLYNFVPPFERLLISKVLKPLNAKYRRGPWADNPDFLIYYAKQEGNTPSVDVERDSAAYKYFASTRRSVQSTVAQNGMRRRKVAHSPPVSVTSKDALYLLSNAEGGDGVPLLIPA